MLKTIREYIKNKPSSSTTQQKANIENLGVESMTNTIFESTPKISPHLSNTPDWGVGDNYYFERLLKSTNNIEEITDLVVQACAHKVKAEKCSLMLLDENKQILTVKKSKGIKEYAIKNAKVRLGEGIAGLVALKRKTFLVTDIKKETNLDSKNSDRYKSNSFISIPLKVKSETIGVLNLTDKINNQHFTIKDLHLIATLVSYAAIAIKNSLIFNELQNLSITDELTGLYNRRHFHNCLENEIERTTRYIRNFTLAMFDIDNFKYYNDKYGHLAGDSILIQISNIFKKHTRNIDIVARYGGEEFAIIFPETRDIKNPTASSKWLDPQFPERIRIVVENHKFLNIDPHKALNLTISGGIAVFPPDGKTKMKLISRADNNLYQAKRKGRNRIYVG